MPFVRRDHEGKIVALHAVSGEGTTEELSADHPEVLDFLGLARDRRIRDLTASDADMARVVEDLVYLLIDKRVIMLTDLPRAARDKLARRRGMRDELADLGGIVAHSEELMLP